jgi:hypothetical protein
MVSNLQSMTKIKITSLLESFGHETHCIADMDLDVAYVYICAKTCIYKIKNVFSNDTFPPNMITFIFKTRQPIRVLSLHNRRDHQTSFIVRHVGFHVTF